MTDIQQRVYNRLPVWGQNVAVSAYGLVIKHRRYGGEFQRYFHELMDSQWFSKDEIEALQRRKLQEIVRWAYEQVPFQKRRFDEAGIDPYKVESIEDLRELPVMTSQDLRRLGKQLVARNHKGRLYKTYSSGTTGTPTCTYVTADDLRRNYAFAARSLTWAGIPLRRHRMATFGVRMVSPQKRSTPPYWRYDIVADNYHFSIYHQSERSLPAYCNQLSKIKPIHIRAFPSALHVLCSFMKKRPEMPRPPAPVAIITSAETLYDHHRALIEEVLRCKIYDEYGCNELSLLATQCDRGSYHLNSEFGIVEFEALRSRAGQGKFGNPVCTAFVNWTTPIIRYKMSDLIELGEPCPCGRNLPTLKRVIGRQEDLILTPEGNYVARLDPIFKRARGVIEAQIVQDSVEHVIVRFVPDGLESIDGTIEVLEKGMRDKLGNTIKIDYEPVAFIQRAPNGKFRAVVSKVSKSD